MLVVSLTKTKPRKELHVSSQLSCRKNLGRFTASLGSVLHFNCLLELPFHGLCIRSRQFLESACSKLNEPRPVLSHGTSWKQTSLPVNEMTTSSSASMG